ncbi:MAG: Gfo/Idh/MocA family oxidoreductase [Anaerolineae bacterium]|nr:Gfo/Idh/MocA family oxidoreductase [Anaerolineae bacterium]MDW8099350.1 Gfo/Idh/MocA family oxidoreductase [Anaerolineae bacterium]
MQVSVVPTQLDYKPRLPVGYRPGIGIIGCGNIVKSAHLKAYKQYGLNVVGVYDIVPEATRGVQEEFGVQHVFRSLEELLSHPDIEVVDIATHPDQRVPLMHQAIEAGKHILAQKPLALTVREAREVVEKAERRGLKIAVNQNGRWAPPWRIATLLIQQGIIGDVLAVTHLYDMKFNWIPGTHFDELRHFAIYDYSIHWIDITRCWTEGKVVATVRARDYRTPNQPATGKTPWGMWVEIAYADGTSAMIRGIGCSETYRRGHPFWIHGAEGTIRGSVLGEEFVELETKGVTCRYQLEGQWFPDGFAGTMGELLCAIAEGREPYNSAYHNLLSLQITLAACLSADRDGAPVALEEVQ